MNLLEYQEERISLIKKLLPMFGERFILKGGTALILYYGIDRFSEDIDLDIISGSLNIAKLLKNPGYSEWNISVKKDTETVFRVMIDYGAKNHLGNYPLKIEVSCRNKRDIQAGLRKFKNINNVNVYTLDEIIEQKIVAMGKRDKIRDFFDVAMLLEKYPEKFTKEQLKSIKTSIDYSNLEDFNYLLKMEIHEHKLKEIDTEKFVLEFYENLENRLYSSNISIEWS